MKQMLIRTRRVCSVVALALAFETGGCAIDDPVLITPREGGPPAERLSQLAIFAGDISSQQPAAGVFPYEVRAPLWSGGASKLRFMWLPSGQKLTEAADWWTVPEGTWLVKTFYFPRDARDPNGAKQLLETRVLSFERGAVKRATYVWNDAQTEAFASGGQVDIPVHWTDGQGVARDLIHHVPGTSQCGWCHRGADQNRGLGLRTWQMNIDGSFGDGSTNQIDHLVAIGILDQGGTNRERVPDPYGDGPVAERALTYLRANCATCHRPDGYAASTGVLFDTPTNVAGNICRPTTSIDGSNRVIVPGRPESSEMIARMLSTDPYVHMPYGPIHIPDLDGIAVLEEWIKATTPGGCP